MGNLRKACEAVASYLLFFPDDETMLSNMKYYSSVPKVQENFFQPREVRFLHNLLPETYVFVFQEAIRYMQRQIYETKILKFINNEFKSKMAEQDSNEVFLKYFFRYL